MDTINLSTPVFRTLFSAALCLMTPQSCIGNILLLNEDINSRHGELRLKIPQDKYTMKAILSKGQSIANALGQAYRKSNPSQTPLRRIVFICKNQRYTYGVFPVKLILDEVFSGIPYWKIVHQKREMCLVLIGESPLKCRTLTPTWWSAKKLYPNKSDPLGYLHSRLINTLCFLDNETVARIWHESKKAPDAILLTAGVNQSTFINVLFSGDGNYALIEDF